MKSVRVTLAVLALLALPLVTVAAQGNSAENKCKNSPQAGKNAASQGGAAAAAEAQLHKNCVVAAPPGGDPPPSDEPPPTGIHSAAGFVYEDVDGDGHQNMWAGELGLAGWVVELYWNGQMIGSRTVGGDGYFKFDALGNSGTATWTVCVIPQGGYNRTEPATGNACGGNGYAFPLNGVFPTEFAAQFGFMLPL